MIISEQDLERYAQQHLSMDQVAVISYKQIGLDKTRNDLPSNITDIFWNYLHFHINTKSNEGDAERLLDISKQDCILTTWLFDTDQILEDNVIRRCGHRLPYVVSSNIKAIDIIYNVSDFDVTDWYTIPKPMSEKIDKVISIIGKQTFLSKLFECAYQIYKSYSIDNMDKLRLLDNLLAFTIRREKQDKPEFKLKILDSVSGSKCEFIKYQLYFDSLWFVAFKDLSSIMLLLQVLEHTKSTDRALTERSLKTNSIKVEYTIQSVMGLITVNYHKVN